MSQDAKVQNESVGTELIRWGDAVARRVEAAVIDAAALTQTSARTRDIARRWMSGRLVRVPGGTAPLMLPVVFEPNEDGQLTTTVSYAGGSELVRPLITVGVPYLKKYPNQELYYSGGTFICMFFRPQKVGGGRREIFRAFPIGLIDSSILHNFNLVADDKPEWGWPHIDPIPNPQLKSGARLMTFVPQFVDRIDSGDPNSAWTFGYYQGKRVIMERGSQFFPVSDQEMEKGISTSHVFRYMETENAIYVRWLGPEEGMRIEDRVPLSDIYSQIDPFSVLATDINTFNPDRVDRDVARQTSRGRTQQNQLFVSARDLGLVLDSDSDGQVATQIGLLATEAVNQAKAMWYETFDGIKSDLARIVGGRVIKDLLQGRLLSEVLVSLNPDDATSKLLATQMRTEFNWASPLHRAVRSWFLQAVADFCKYSDPVAVSHDPEAVAEESLPVTQPVSEPEVSVAPATGSNGEVLVEKPKRVRKSRAKVKAVPASEAAVENPSS